MDINGNFYEIQIEMKNILLDNGEKVILIIKWKRIWMNPAHDLVCYEM